MEQAVGCKYKQSGTQGSTLHGMNGGVFASTSLSKFNAGRPDQLHEMGGNPYPTQKSTPHAHVAKDTKEGAQKESICTSAA